MTSKKLISSRRQVLRSMFLGSVALGIYGCGGSSSSSNNSSTPDTPDVPDVPDVPDPVVPATELPLQAGPLANIGNLVESDVDGTLIPEGFSIRRVARAGFSPSFNFTLWHSNPDGGAVFQADGCSSIGSNPSLSARIVANASKAMARSPRPSSARAELIWGQ